MPSHDGHETDSQAGHSQDRLPLSRRNYLQVTGAAAVGSFTAMGGAAAQHGNAKRGRDAADDSPLLSDLRVEYATDPLGIDVATPRLSWTVVAPGHDWAQSAYRILVASSRSKLDDNDADVWDSGQINSSHSINIEYGGPSLESKTAYYWKVRTWDADGEATAWSDAAYWETGLMDDDEWNSNWIGADNIGSEELVGLNWTDYTFEADFEIVSENAGFVFRAQDDENLYMWQFNTKARDAPILREHVREDGDYDVLKEVSLTDVVGDTLAGQHNVKIAIKDDKFTTFIDGTEVDTTTSSTFSSGTIGFREDPSERALFDNIEVTKSDGTVLYEDDFSNPGESKFPDSWVEGGKLDVSDSGPLLFGELLYENPSPLLRTETVLNSEIKRARAYISGLGFHEFYINGEKISEQVLNPARTNYDETVLYETYDVTDQLANGMNALGVMLGQARYDDRNLLFRLDVDLADGSTKTVVSNEGWAATDGPIRQDSYMDGEVYDAQQEQPGWTKPGFDDSDWSSATSADGPSGDLTNQMIQPGKKKPLMKPVKRWEPKSGVYIFDMGEMLTGWPHLTVEGAAGTSVTLKPSERLKGFPNDLGQHGTIDDQPGVDQYILNGQEIETYEPRFAYQGFRYIQVEGYPGEPTIDDIKARNVHNAVDEGAQSSFACSSDLLNQIHQNTQRALLNNLHSNPTDTPVFEKLGYGADGMAMAETAIYNYHGARFYSKWTRDFMDCQNDGGEMPDIAPANTRHGHAPPWGSASLIVPWWIYKYYNDERILRENYDRMKAFVNSLKDQAGDNLIHPGGYGDYNAPGTYGRPPEGSKITGTSYVYHDAVLLSKIASLLGNDNDAATYAALAEDIRQAFNNEFLNEDTDIYRTGETNEYRQTSNLLPLAFDMVPENHHDAVVDNLVHDIMERQDGHLNTGSVGTKPLLQMLTKLGHHDVAYTVATQTDYPSWGNWNTHGFTALLEDWNITGRTRSLDHEYLGSIDEWFYQYLAGIRMPSEPGFKQVKIAPEPVPDLDWVKATVETVRGIVKSHWKREATPGKKRTLDGLTLDVTIPGNATATVRVPTLGGEKVRVREGGKPIWNNGHRTGHHHPGVQNVERDDDRIAVEVSSGGYQLELEQLGNGNKHKGNGRGNSRSDRNLKR